MRTAILTLRGLFLAALLLASFARVASARTPIDVEIGNFDPPAVRDPVLRAPREVPLPVRFLRGDADGSGKVELADALTVLSNLFLGTKPLGCADAADTNDDGQLSMSDAIHTLSFLFLGGVNMPAPFPECGVDPTSDALSCGEGATCSPELATPAFQITRTETGYLLDLPEEMVAVLPEESEMLLGASRDPLTARAGVARKLSKTSVFVETQTSLRLGTGVRPIVSLQIPTAVARMPALGFDCGPSVCTCSGDEDCNRLFSTDSCTGGFCVIGPSGQVWCICAARY